MFEENTGVLKRTIIHPFSSLTIQIIHVMKYRSENLIKVSIEAETTTYACQSVC